MQGAQENSLRSSPSGKTILEEGFLCQKKERLRSLLSANEEAALWILGQKAPYKIAFIPIR